MSRCLLVLLVRFVSLSAEAITGDVTPPTNLSVAWVSDFQPVFSWRPRRPPANCQYEVMSETEEKYSRITDKLPAPPYRPYVTMEGGHLHFSVRTVCGTAASPRAVLNVSYAELARDLQCYVVSSATTRCSWRPTGRKRDVRLYYRSLNENGSSPGDDEPPPTPLKECTSYAATDGGARTGCDLQAGAHQSVHVLFNGTLERRLVRNTFRNMLTEVKPPPLNWTVTLSGTKFNISWIPPDVLPLSAWTFVLNYTECNERKIKESENVRSVVLDRVSHCRYIMALAAHSSRGESPWTDKVYFDADPNPLLYALLIVPLASGLVILILVCCRKTKEQVFTKVPEPCHIFGDISDKERCVYSPYEPPKEEDFCTVTPLAEQQRG